jgi:hypothetical protein
MNSTALDDPLRVAWRRSLSVLRGIAIVFSIALLTIVALSPSSWEYFQFLLGCGLFFTALFLAAPLSKRVLIRERGAFLSAALVIWVFLMVSEAMFSHVQSTASAAQGHVDPSAMFQALSWILSFGILVLISYLRPAYLRRLFAGPLKWASIFAIVAVLSCPLSRKPMYSAALAFKLCLIVLILCAIGEAVEDEAGILKLFTALFVGMIIVVSKSFTSGLIATNFLQLSDRLPMVGLSGASGIVLLLCLFFFFVKKSPMFLVVGLFSVVAMILAFNKGGLVASFVSLMLFFLLLKKPAQTLALSFGLGIILLLLLAFTPLGKELEYFGESKSATTLTGRTNLWSNAWPNIGSHLILGNGYRDSRFLSEEVPGAFQDAGNMHNSFLEVLYNNGLVGLIPIAMVCFLTVSNLTRVILHPPTLQMRYYGAAALALFILLFVWGLVAVTFGGAPDERFMTFLAVLVISMFLRGQCDKTYRNEVYGEHFS